MKHVLVVDDDPDIVTVLAEALSPTYRVSTAANGQVALASIVSERPDAVLLDLMMPVMDGVAFLAALRALSASIPVILLSATTRLPERCQALAVRAFLAKPFDLPALEAKLSQVLG